MKHRFPVIPAQAGIHRPRVGTRDDIPAMDTRLRGDDGRVDNDGAVTDGKVSH